MFTRRKVDLKYLKKNLKSTLLQVLHVAMNNIFSIILIIENEIVKCHLCNFHYKFNVFLGHEALKQLKTTWVIDQDLIRMDKKYFKLQYLQQSNVGTNKRENYNTEIKRIQIRSNHLNLQEKYELEKLLRKYSVLFPNSEETLSQTTNIKHKINTTDEIPIYSRLYRYPYIYKKEIKDQVKDLLKKEIIRESHSPWRSPV